MRPYGFWGGWVFCEFLRGFGRTRCAPTGFCGDLVFFEVFVGIWAHAMRPYGFLGGFGGFQEKYVRANCDRL
ncbi:hypothetical protein C789_4600 [Microcystis aeruginosa FACHB-905 = DIANCHI905]|nr:hypothetical protein C789_4600 [Microcystis aeruginosa FACHB-905 = DIANCHI905]